MIAMTCLYSSSASKRWEYKNNEDNLMGLFQSISYQTRNMTVSRIWPFSGKLMKADYQKWMSFPKVGSAHDPIL